MQRRLTQYIDQAAYFGGIAARLLGERPPYTFNCALFGRRTRTFSARTCALPATRIKAVPPPFRSYVLVSREQIARNYRNVRSVVGPGVEVAGVVKADAYGHGALEVSRVLVAEGARWLAVSSVEEGVAPALRRHPAAAHPGDGRLSALRRPKRWWSTTSPRRFIRCEQIRAGGPAGAAPRASRSATT